MHYRNAKPRLSMDLCRIYAVSGIRRTAPAERLSPARSSTCTSRRTSSRHGDTRRLVSGALSPASCRQAIGIVSGLFSYLVNAGYLAGNPWALKRRRAKQRGRPAVERYLDQQLWALLLSFVETEPRSSTRDQQRYERDRWVLRLLYSTALRAAEAADVRAGDFSSRRGRWWLTVRGKGGSVEDVPVSEALLADYMRYRAFHKMPAAWDPDDGTPLILGIAGRGLCPLTSTAVYLIVKGCFGRAADRLEPTDPIRAARLQRASTHWLRHTAATHQADAGVDVRHIQRNLRHASIGVTSIYLHSDDDARHDELSGDFRWRLADRLRYRCSQNKPQQYPPKAAA